MPELRMKQDPEHKCGHQYLVNSDEGYHTVHECQFRRRTINIGRKDKHWLAKGCLFHLDPKAEIEGDDETAQTRRAELEKLKDAELREFLPLVLTKNEGDVFSEIGTRDFPLADLKFRSNSEDIEVELASRGFEISGKNPDEPIEFTKVQRPELHILNSEFKPPLFIRESTLDHLRIRDCEMSVVTIIDCNIGAIEVLGGKTSRLNFIRSSVDEVVTDVSYDGLNILETKLARLQFRNGGVRERLRVKTSRVEIDGGDFSKANIEESQGASFSLSRLIGSSNKAKHPDNWRLLKTKYNANNSLLALFFFAVFLLPFVVEYLELRTLDVVRQSATTISSASGNAIQVPSLCIGVECQERRAVTYIFDRLSIFYKVLTVCLLSLNLVRIYVVSQVAKLREWEEQSGIYPYLGTTIPFKFEGLKVVFSQDWGLSYRRLVVLDGLSRYLIIAAYVSLVLTAYSMWQEYVLVPI